MFVAVDELAPEPVDKVHPRLRYRYGEARSVWLASTGEDRRVCTECRIEYPLEDFHRIDRDRRVTICRPCRLEKQKAYRAGLSADRRARNRLGMAAWRFGLTPEAVEQILVQQGNRCAICDRIMTRGAVLRVRIWTTSAERGNQGASYARSATSRSATSNMSSDSAPNSWRE